MSRKKSIIITVASLLIGFSAYLFFNRASIIGLAILKYINIPQIEIHNRLLYIILHSFFADFCWAFALPFAVQAVLCVNHKQIAYLMLCSILGILVEVLQKVHLIIGTFDYFDILVYLIATILAVIVIYKGGKNQ